MAKIINISKGMIMVLVLPAFTMSAATVSAQSTGEMAPAPAPSLYTRAPFSPDFRFCYWILSCSISSYALEALRGCI
ncbi:hypothetical protein Pint_17958 [Pistacia integerrima]|uniref:Uncharacterized protein n=1 Tax=Pistacia integerrima TaxID=434235 RepID=A0ACC0YY39_9ROSI|nr:hypothetical protein Pint_17958 [Pistacia integerrima]